PTGGVCRRPGTRLIQELSGGRRLIDYDDGVYAALIVLSASTIQIIEDGELIQTISEDTWDDSRLAEIAWARQKNQLILVHPDIEPRILTRTSAGWSIEAGLPWERDGSGKVLFEPFARFADGTIELELHSAGGGQLSGPASGTVDIVANAEVFSLDHQGAKLKFRGVEIKIDAFISSTRVRGTLEATVPEARATRDWQEQAFSQARGWPRTLCFHQDRLVIGGSRDFPDYVWMSRTGRYFSFDLGEGLDDEAIVFRLNSDRLDLIRAVFPGRRLQIFTNKGEWVVTGNPITPTTTAVDLQTRVGSYSKRRLNPIDVDGATLFVGAGGRDLREFLYSESEQAYQSADLALLSRHLMREPRDLCFDSRNRLVLIVREDGGAALISIDRNSNVIAWSRMAIRGQIIACTTHQGAIYILSEYDGRTVLEQLDADQSMDHVWIETSSFPRNTWAGLSALDGLMVTLIGDGRSLGEAEVVGGTVTAPLPVMVLEVGLPFEQEVEPLPVIAGGNRGTAQDQLYRPIHISFRLLETDTLIVDSGGGFRSAPVPASDDLGFSGDVRISAFGWRRPFQKPSWRIRQATPEPFCLLSVTTEMKVNS
ncbi:MAG: hypothetical protein AAFY56_22525, partial [Pseudomonadota bacterium]